MSQKRARGLRALARRYGLAAGGRVALVCVLLIMVVGAMGVFGALGIADRPTFRITENNVSDEQSKQPQSDETQADVHTVVVHVDGSVGEPGVYVLEGESIRVNDAIEMAGGLLPDADTTTMNLAATIEDGQKIYVPKQGEEPDAVAINAGVTAIGPAEGAITNGRVNVNTATLEDLQRLPGVGEATAAAIIEDRERNGAFLQPEDLMRVSGIGEKKFEKMRDMVDV